MAHDGYVGFDAEGKSHFLVWKDVEGKFGFRNRFYRYPDVVAFFKRLSNDFNVFGVFDAVAHDESVFLRGQFFEDDEEFGFGADFEPVFGIVVEDLVDDGFHGIDFEGIDNSVLALVFVFFHDTVEDV